MREVKEDLRKIKAYSKEEIIEAIQQYWNSDRIIGEILCILEQKRVHSIFAEHDKALKTEISASDKYCEWMKKMCVNYGDGKTVKISDIPMEELTYGVELEKALKIAEENERKLDKKVHKLLGVLK